MTVLAPSWINNQTKSVVAHFAQLPGLYMFKFPFFLNTLKTSSPCWLKSWGSNHTMRPCDMVKSSKQLVKEPCGERWEVKRVPTAYVSQRGSSHVSTPSKNLCHFSFACQILQHLLSKVYIRRFHQAHHSFMFHTHFPMKAVLDLSEIYLVFLVFSWF